MNQTILVGNLVRDAELKYTSSGDPVMTYTIAWNRRVRGEEKAHFFDCVTFGKTAENIGQYMTKGKLVGVRGELRQNRWEQDGKTRSKIEIVVFDVQLLGGKPKDGFDDDIPF